MPALRRPLPAKGRAPRAPASLGQATARATLAPRPRRAPFRHPCMRMKWPSSLRRLERCEAMKPPAPVTQIFIFLWPSVNFFSATEGRTCRRAEAVSWTCAGWAPCARACVPRASVSVRTAHRSTCIVLCEQHRRMQRGRALVEHAPWLRAFQRRTHRNSPSHRASDRPDRSLPRNASSGRIFFFQLGRMVLLAPRSGGLCYPS